MILAAAWGGVGGGGEGGQKVAALGHPSKQGTISEPVGRCHTGS